MYSELLESILPLGYHQLLLEPVVLGRVYKNLLDQIIDEKSSAIFKATPELCFSRHFQNLFTEFKNKKIVDAIFDLLFVLGSGTTSSTLSEPELRVVGDERPMCRTS